jgi:acetyl-CoA carboxylase carboxyl transferase subunit alpha
MAAKTWREWEKPLLELEAGIAQLKRIARDSVSPKKEEIEGEVRRYERALASYLELMYSRLGPWETVLVARAEKRPYTLDYINALFTDFVELEGDRRFGADKAIVGGPAFLDGIPCMVIGHQKGRNIQERQQRNFAMAKPEGYRKAVRLFEMADRFRLPVIAFIDTPAADPGVESESRGIAEAIAASIQKMFEIAVPSISIIIGEGGSGGAIGLAASNRVLMQAHAMYSVIPPEGCAAILWRLPDKGPEAAAALRLTASAAHELGLIDEIVPEPLGGAHRDPSEAAAKVKTALLRHLADLNSLAPDQVKAQRYAKFREMGRFRQ